MKIELLDKDCLPVKKHQTDAGWDLIASDSCTIAKTNVRAIGAGFKIAIPEGYMGLLAPRSGLGIKGVHLANVVGIIDSDYRGEVIVNIKNNTKMSLLIEKGERFAQMVIVPISLELLEVVESLDETERGSGGFGSTGTTSACVLPSEAKFDVEAFNTTKKKLDKLVETRPSMLTVKEKIALTKAKQGEK